MLRAIVVVLVFVMQGATLVSQDSAWLRGRILNKISGKAIPFASVQIKSRNVGVITSAAGDFQIPKYFKDRTDTLLISCIGFESRYVPLATFPGEIIFLITLKESVTELSAVDITSKRRRLSANTIIKAALHNLPYNYPAAPLVYEGYYRDYQVEDSTYVNLNEAIVQEEDSGYSTNDQLKTKIKLLSYVANEDFRRDTTAEIAL